MTHPSATSSAVPGCPEFAKGRRPCFVIVGAMSSGTTTLQEYLARHDGVYVPGREVHYFSKDANYRRGVEWYESRFADAHPDQIVGEKSASYHYVEAAPARLAELLPDAKLVWIFREPIARAYAHYWNAVCHGRESLSFERALREEPHRVTIDATWGYCTRSMYADQVKRYLKHFDRARMLFFLLDDLIADPCETVNRLFRFIGVPTPVGIGDAIRSNERKWIPWSRRFQYLAQKRLGTKSGVYRMITRLNTRLIDAYPPMTRAARERIRPALQAQIDELERLIGRDLSGWRSTGSADS